MEYPKVYLTLDNCFAIKRWVEPSEWMPLIRDIGFTSAQASFDNEIDFLYSPEWYKSGWFQEVSRQEKETGLRVDTFLPVIRPTGLRDLPIRMIKWQII